MQNNDSEGFFAEKPKRRIFTDDSDDVFPPSVDDEPIDDDYDKPNIDPERIKEIRYRQANRTATHILTAVVLVILTVSVSVILSYYIVRGSLDFVGIGMRDYDIRVEIPPYATVDEVAALLHNNGIVDTPELFKLYVKVSGKDTGFIAGEYTLGSNLTYSTMVRLMQTTKKETKLVTLQIMDGMTVAQIGDLLEENGVCRSSDFLKFAATKNDWYNFEKRLHVDTDKYLQLEGFLYPDTYEFYSALDIDGNMPENTIKEAETAIRKLFSNFNSKITKEMYREMYDEGFQLNEFVTLASMVQKEAGTVEEMGLVASVFKNRLEAADNFPYLQSDVTVLYAENFIKPNLADLSGNFSRIPELYNSYKSKGLPPGPICSPSGDAMKAVLNSPKTNYYYFCAEPNTMEMYFAETLAEHERNLDKIGLGGSGIMVE
ncbi:MAG: endolytic transglycosylase MltG [Oscillospiraceae bacterium]|jgi:UPF0755 protein|nr:endolytic transglycosylase MltG [Oscillospiraceae bacterium]